jgi:hypothetical protein
MIFSLAGSSGSGQGPVSAKGNCTPRVGSVVTDREKTAGAVWGMCHADGGQEFDAREIIQEVVESWSGGQKFLIEKHRR